MIPFLKGNKVGNIHDVNTFCFEKKTLLLSTYTLQIWSEIYFLHLTNHWGEAAWGDPVLEQMPWPDCIILYVLIGTVLLLKEGGEGVHRCSNFGSAALCHLYNNCIATKRLPTLNNDSDSLTKLSSCNPVNLPMVTQTGIHHINSFTSASILAQTGSPASCKSMMGLDSEIRVVVLKSPSCGLFSTTSERRHTALRCHKFHANRRSIPCAYYPWLHLRVKTNWRCKPQYSHFHSL